MNDNIQSIIAYKAGLPSKWTVHYALVNDFTISDTEILNQLDKYYKLFWKAGYFDPSVLDGTILHQDIRYLVIYKNCNPYQIRKLDKTEQIELSFRKAKPEYQLAAYVIVRIPS